MDGTLTEELLDFDLIRRDIGLPAEGGILEHLAGMPPPDRRRADAILDRHELAAADASVLHDGAAAVLDGLARRGVRTALLTRNSTACADRILGRHRLSLDWVATREHLPHKPHPDSILNITRRLGVDPRQTLMVGDYLYDLQAAAAAGVDSALLCVKPAWPAFAEQATHRVRRLTDLLPLVFPDDLSPASGGST
jgi:phosphoglycolate phosphatase-like HAD superfamily hydrolase